MQRHHIAAPLLVALILSAAVAHAQPSATTGGTSNDNASWLSNAPLSVNSPPPEAQSPSGASATAAFTPPPRAEAPPEQPPRVALPPGIGESAALPATSVDFPRLVPRTPILRDDTATDAAASDEPESPRTGTSVWPTVVLFLLVIAGLGVVAALLRKRGIHRFGGLSNEALDVLGQRRIDPKTSVHYLRIGNRIVVVGLGADGPRTLLVIDDPAEVDYLAGLCKTTDGTAAQAFQNLFQLRLGRRSSSPAGQAEPIPPATRTHADPRTAAPVRSPSTAAGVPLAAQAAAGRKTQASPERRLRDALGGLKRQ